MSRINKISRFILLFILFLGATFLINIKTSHAESKYQIELEPSFTDKDTVLSFEIKNKDENVVGAKAIANGKTYAIDKDEIQFFTINDIYFPKSFKGGTEIKLYITYKDVVKNEEITEEVAKVKVKDTTPPSLKVPSVDIRSTSLKVTSEKGTAITATFNGKKIKVKKNSNTQWTLYINKPIKNKKLVITAKDAAGNTKKIAKTFIVPYDVFLSGNSIKVGDKYAKGYAFSGKSTDRVYLKIGSKTYRGSVKKEKFSIKISKNVSSPKTVTLYLKDKYNNILATDKIRIYKYSKIKIGMTKSQIKNSYYGAPDDTKTFVYPHQKWEQWHYYVGDDLKTILSFLNGKLYSIDKF